MFGNHISIWKDVSWAKINQIQKLRVGLTIDHRKNILDIFGNILV
jgi:hypothetical protein